VKLFGVSTDSVDSHRKFRASLDLPFSLLADTEGEMVRKFDAVMSIPAVTMAARKIVLIDRAGKVAYRDEEYDLGSGADLEALKAAVAKAAGQ